jgi:LPXTG-motif cell wall-anchored protein
VLATGTNSGTLTLNADGSFVYSPNTGFTGFDTFSYYAEESPGVGAGGFVVISVVNSTPIPLDDEYTLEAGAPLTVAAPGVVANDVDADGDPLSATLWTGPASGAVTLSPDGSFVYTPVAGFYGDLTFYYGITDYPWEGPYLGQVTIHVVNAKPVAVNDAYGTTAGTTLTIAPSGVLGNDSDFEGDPFTAVLVAGPAHGLLTLDPSGGFTYIPNAGFAGTDSFSYVGEDAAPGNLGTVTITVSLPPAPGTSAPAATGSGSVARLPNTGIEPMPGVLAAGALAALGVLALAWRRRIRLS